VKYLKLSVINGDGITLRRFPVKRMVNAGYVGRDLQAVKAHIEELRREGVPPPPSVPIIFPVLSHNITTAHKIEVIGGKTSGEVEFALLLNKGEIFVGVGSDHTDREVERNSIAKSKQICQNVLSSQVWRYKDVESRWDDLLLQSWVKQTEGDDWFLYQKALLRNIIPAAELISLVKSGVKDGDCEGLVIFSGTIPCITEEIIFGSGFRSELIDKKGKRRLTCEYRVQRLEYMQGAESL
jgi:hypothetical protein